jgi:hypothetical protein
MGRHRPPLTLRQILAWADAHHARTGGWPSACSGPVADAPGEKWAGLDVALAEGRRGLPGGDSLARLLDRRRRGGAKPRRPPVRPWTPEEDARCPRKTRPGARGGARRRCTCGAPTSASPGGTPADAAGLEGLRGRLRPAGGGSDRPGVNGWGGGWCGRRTTDGLRMACETPSPRLSARGKGPARR